ncbi:Rieske 2Fe-2S domain-containing protein [Streptomyces sp. NBC_00118]|uniref:Rieske 2Fe-2S domain-containing protein n=1 Tax=Streptomyces sp. NBC_00118 TaxID=2975658 RepID=UPI003870BE99
MPGDVLRVSQDASTAARPHNEATASHSRQPRKETTVAGLDYTRLAAAQRAYCLACPLSAGRLTGTTLMCQCHGSHFDIINRTVLHGPAARPPRH